MKKKLLMILCVTIMCVGLVACVGEDAEPTTNLNSASPAVSQPTTAPTVTPTVEPEQTSVAEDTTAPDEEIVYEDVIGDVDVDIKNITMSDMVPAEIGVDIPLNVQANQLTRDAFGADGLTILFPRAMYWTEQYPQMTKAKRDDSTVYFNINAFVASGTNVSTGRFAEYDYGRYLVYIRNSATRAGTDKEDLSLMSYEIIIVDTEMESYMVIGIGGGMQTDNGIDFLNEYKQLLVDDILAQFDAMAQ